MTAYKETILIIVAHTDDETLGMGGTIAKHIEAGDNVVAISMTDGIGARPHTTALNQDNRMQAAINASKILGFTWLKQYDFPDNAMDTIALLEVVKAIEAIKEIVSPTIIYTHSTADLNIDHRIVAEATLIAFRPQPQEVWNEIRTFEIPSATDYGHPDITHTFLPNLIISIEDTWPKKLLSLHAYSDEMRPEPHARSFQGLENLARYRGNQVGVNMAEAFQIIRKIIR